MTKIESGRSMVEMLGVLAIIGVLSIGGIAGYTTAMNRYRANEILDLASKVAVIAMTKSPADAATVTANLADVTSQATPIHGVTTMEGVQNGTVTISGNLQPGVQNAINSIAPDKVDSVSATGATFYPEGKPE